MITKSQLLEPLARLRTDQIVVTTMGVVRPWGRLSAHPFDFASADSAMGHAADLALGLALAQPQRRVICLNGDGSMLMTLGTFVTIVQAGARNLLLFVVENATYEITGNQPVPGAGRVDFAAMARAAGFARTFTFKEAEPYSTALPDLLALDGPVCVVVRTEHGHEPPMSRRPDEVPCLQRSLAEDARRLRAALLDATARRSETASPG